MPRSLDPQRYGGLHYPSYANTSMVLAARKSGARSLSIAWMARRRSPRLAGKIRRQRTNRVTEIPEHLLKRSKERRAAIGGDSADTESAPAESSPSAERAPAPAVISNPRPAEPAPQPPPEPLRPEVEAALRRHKIPYWALPVLLALPLWAYVYHGTLEPPAAPAVDALAHGEDVYARCAFCHGASGQGASGPALTGVMDSFPDWRDHLSWVAVGTQGWPGDTYGAGVPKSGGTMPPFGNALSLQELAAVVLYERVAFGGLAEDSEAYLALEAVANGEISFEEAGLGPAAEAAGVDPVDVPAG
jgi:mono/diheme cytochrome c family protein